MTAQIKVEVGDLQGLPEQNEKALKEYGDHCGFGYRVVVDSMLIPLPFVRMHDAERAGKAIAEAMERGNLPQGWGPLRRFMIEALAW